LEPRKFLVGLLFVLGREVIGKLECLSDCISTFASHFVSNNSVNSTFQGGYLPIERSVYVAESFGDRHSL
jgi:hypothetical protein